MNITVRETDQATVLELSESLISPQDAVDLEDALQAIMEDGPKNIVVNLDGVEMVNQKSWGTLAKFARSLRPEGKDIKLVGLNSRLQGHFDRLLHLSEVMETYPTEEDAFASFTDNISHVERNILWGLK